MSCKAVDSQSQEQSGNEVGDDDASHSGRVQLHTVLAHYGGGEEESFQGQGTVSAPRKTLGSPFQDPHFSEMVMTLLLPSPPSSQGTDGEKHDIHGTLTKEWTEPPPPSQSLPPACLSQTLSHSEALPDKSSSYHRECPWFV